MNPLSHEGAGAVGAPAQPAKTGALAADDDALRFSRSLPFASADATIAMLAYATNQAVASHVALAHQLGEFVHAQARELSIAGARAFPPGILRDAVTSLASIEAGIADSMIAAANRYGRRFAHLAFAFPVPSRGAR